MPISHLAIILYTTVLAFCALYAPQPLLPLLSQELHVDADHIGLLISAAMLPLGIAPVLYGYLLESFSALKLLKLTVLLLALSELPILWSDQFEVILAVRLVQGLLLPAILTALMTYLSTVSRPEYIRRKMSYYIAATILGGLLGRLISGMAATWLDWRSSFLIIMIGLFIAYGLLFFLHGDTRLNMLRPSWKTVKKTVFNPLYSKLYWVIFLVFFCFAGLLNLLPFRLRELNPAVSDFVISLSYSGYIVGLLVAVNCAAICRYLGGEMRAVFIGLIVYLSAVLLFAWPGFLLTFSVMAIFCFGMFLIHTTLSAHLNHIAQDNKGLVNGLYLSFYYAGGTLGSYIPGLFYQKQGWFSYIALASTLILLAGLITWRLMALEKTA